MRGPAPGRTLGPMSHPLAIVTAAALILGVLSGCGGDGADEGPTRAQYAARADRICRETSAQAAPLLRRLAAGVSGLTADRARALAPVGTRVHALARDYVQRLSALEQPPDDRDEIATFLSRTRQVVDAIGRSAAALSAGRTVEALGTLQATQSAAAEANGAAAGLGLDGCASVLTIG